MKPMFGALACLFCILLLLVCVVIDTSSTSSSSQAVKMMEISENLLSTSSKERQVHRHHRLNTDLFRGSKRRVPNGPDPIHNRYYLVKHFSLIFLLLLLLLYPVHHHITLAHNNMLMLMYSSLYVSCLSYFQQEKGMVSFQ